MFLTFNKEHKDKTHTQKPTVLRFCFFSFLKLNDQKLKELIQHVWKYCLKDPSYSSSIATELLNTRAFQKNKVDVLNNIMKWWSPALCKEIKATHMLAGLLPQPKIPFHLLQNENNSILQRFLYKTFWVSVLIMHYSSLQLPQYSTN